MLSDRNRGRRRPFPFHAHHLEPRFLLAGYFVSPAGNDTNPGTTDAPWLTLQHAANTVAAGDTVTVRAGTYAGFQVTTDGTPTAPITFTAQPTVTINQPNAFNTSGISIEGADYVTVDGFRVITMAGAAIRSNANTGVVIRNNTLDNNAGPGIFTSFSQGVVIEGNSSIHSSTRSGIEVTASADNPVIRGNRSIENAVSGIVVSGEAAAAGGDGNISGALVEHNTVFGNGRNGGAEISLDGVQSSTVRNNLLYNAHGHGIWLQTNRGAGASIGNAIVNNTVIVSSDGGWALRLSEGATGAQAFNNILINDNPANGVLEVSPDSYTGFAGDHNVVAGDFSDGVIVRPFSEWQAVTGQELHSLAATKAQLFANADADDYHLSATSPALDIGTTLLAPATDREGNARPQGGGVDAGAFERAAVAPTSTVQFATNVSFADEGGGAFSATVTRTGDTTAPATVRYATANGSAVHGADYTATSGTLTFAAGETSKTFQVPVTDDATEEPLENLSLVLFAAAGTGLGAAPSATVSIVDNDARATAALAADPWNPRKQALFVNGTQAADTIVVRVARGTANVEWKGESIGSFRVKQFSRVIINGAAGDDRLEMPPTLGKASQLNGGDGNDVLLGGRGKDVLLGGSGADQLTGGLGADMLFGGTGADALNGGSQNDLLVSSAATFEGDSGSLLLLSLVKNSRKQYLKRFPQGTVPPLDAAAVPNDSLPDHITGGLGLDWFVFDPDDVLADRSPDETPATL